MLILIKLDAQVHVGIQGKQCALVIDLEMRALATK